MKVDPVALRICIHLKNGEVVEFSQTDPEESDRILVQNHPPKIFTQDQLVIGGTYSLSAFSTAAICMIEFFMENVPWPNWLPELEATIITKEKFHEQYHRDDEANRREHPYTIGESYTGYSIVKMACGRQLYLEIQGHEIAALDQKHLIYQIFSRPSFHARLPGGGGVSILNTANIEGIIFCPGTAEIPSNAWRARHVLL